MSNIGKTQPDMIETKLVGCLNLTIIKKNVIVKTIHTPWPIETYLELFIIVHELRHWEQFEEHEMNYWFNAPIWYIEYDAERYAQRWFLDRNIPIPSYHIIRATEAIDIYAKKYGETSFKNLNYNGHLIPLQSIKLPDVDEAMERIKWPKR